MTSAEEADIRTEVMTRIGTRKMRYWMARFKREIETGGEVPADGAPEGLREAWEDDPYFGGWENFHVTWDVDEEDYLRIVPLRESKESRWNKQAWANARPLPPLATMQPNPISASDIKEAEAREVAKKISSPVIKLHDTCPVCGGKDAYCVLCGDAQREN